MDIEIEKADSMPKQKRRSGVRTSPQREKLKEAIRGCNVNVIRDVGYPKKYNALQQRIRQAAKAANMNVRVVIEKNEAGSHGDVYFEGYCDKSV